MSTTPLKGYEHCSPLASADADLAHHRAAGAALTASTQRMVIDDVVSVEKDMLGEEVAAVLDGRIAVLAAGEHYVLSAGEAILIPPNEPRRFTCVSSGSVLYRVICDAWTVGNAS
ncbi:cupin domain-containing protein [Caballeronia cordobensis]|uniref:cupin domain-containing protein n=1 Tax=Caballeronia cordobensis TaxID=1353886 RepID=UPI0009EB8974|nr:cupin domain-containing protein [Caballeronia cordobensis]